MKGKKRIYLVRGGRAEDDDWMILLGWPAVALQAMLLAVADWRMAWTVAGLSSSSPLRFFFFCFVLFCFCFLLLYLTVLLPGVLWWLWRRCWWWLLTEEWLGLWSAFLLLLLCVFFSCSVLLCFCFLLLFLTVLLSCVLRWRLLAGGVAVGGDGGSSPLCAEAWAFFFLQLPPSLSISFFSLPYVPPLLFFFSIGSFSPSLSFLPLLFPPLFSFSAVSFIFFLPSFSLLILLL